MAGVVRLPRRPSCVDFDEGRAYVLTVRVCCRKALSRPDGFCRHCAAAVRPTARKKRRDYVVVEVVGVRPDGRLVMKKREKKEIAKFKKMPFPDEEFAARYPNLTEFLVTSRFDDGSPRELSRLSWFLEDGMCKACLNDPAEGASLYVSATSFEEATRLLEASCADPGAPWRTWKDKRGK